MPKWRWAFPLAPIPHKPPCKPSKIHETQQEQPHKTNTIKHDAKIFFQPWSSFSFRPFTSITRILNSNLNPNNRTTYRFNSQFNPQFDSRFGFHPSIPDSFSYRFMENLGDLRILGFLKIGCLREGDDCREEKEKKGEWEKREWRRKGWVKRDGRKR